MTASNSNQAAAAVLKKHNIPQTARFLTALVNNQGVSIEMLVNKKIQCFYMSWKDFVKLRGLD